MKLLLVDTDATGLSLCWRAAQAGHQVRWFIEPKPHNHADLIGKGFKGVEKVTEWLPHAKWADLVLTTANDKYVQKLDWLRRTQGVPYLGPSPASAKLEIDRQAGMELLKTVSLELAEYETFPTVEKAYQHVLKTKQRYVFKTLGDNENKALTYVSKHAADLLGWLERAPAVKGEVMLQAFVDGIELGVSRFMGKTGFVGPWNESFEHKKLMSGNYGPNTGEMGTIAYFTQDSKLGRDTLARLEGKLVELGHTGDVAMGFMVPTDGSPPKFTEFTCRFGWPITNMMLGATKDDPIAWLRAAVDGQDKTSFNEAIGACCVLAHADFPHGHATKKEVAGAPIFGVTRGNRQHLHPQAVQLETSWDMQKDEPIERPTWTTAGDYVMVVTGFGKDVKQATDRLYGTVKQLSIENPIVRDDIGESLEEALPKLHRLGYATHCHYDLREKP